MEIGLDPNNSVIKRLWCICKQYVRFDTGIGVDENLNKYLSQYKSSKPTACTARDSWIIPKFLSYVGYQNSKFVIIFIISP